MDLDYHYWEKLYQLEQTGWDLGEVSPPLKFLIDKLTNKKISILIPGCGNAHEVGYLLSNHFNNITIIDIAASAINDVSHTYQDAISAGNLKVILGDFFEHHQQYDLILEQTFFCAIHPKRRNEYAIKMSELLNPGGRLVGVLFNREFDGGPPFGGNTDEYHILFAPYFSDISITPCNYSAKPRSGTEVFIELIK